MSTGLVLGSRYELVARLGEGGFGTVWRARDVTLGRDVAVKLIHSSNADLARFTREARSLARLNHPNIVIAHDFGVDGAYAYLVMELVEGRSLADDLTEVHGQGHAGLPPADVLDIAEQAANGLAAAHAAGIIHRDLKPRNIMRTRDRRAVKIVDFGIAHAADLSRITASGGVIGTLPYMAPEQLTDEPLDGRADLYSLGCVIYELLTGGSPLRATTPAAWMHAHHFQPPGRLRDTLPKAPAALDLLVDQLLAKRRGERPANAETVSATLARIRSEMAVAATIQVPAPKTQVGFVAPQPPAAVGLSERHIGDVAPMPASAYAPEEQASETITALSLDLPSRAVTPETLVASPSDTLEVGTPVLAATLVEGRTGQSELPDDAGVPPEEESAVMPVPQRSRPSAGDARRFPRRGLLATAATVVIVVASVLVVLTLTSPNRGSGAAAATDPTATASASVAASAVHPPTVPPALGDLTIRLAGGCSLFSDGRRLWLALELQAGWTGRGAFPDSVEFSVTTNYGSAAAYDFYLHSTNPLIWSIGGQPVVGNAWLGHAVTITVTINPAHVVAESNESNNVATITAAVPSSLPNPPRGYIPCH